MVDFYKNIEEYNPDTEFKIFITCNMTDDELSNTNLNPLLTELFVSVMIIIIQLLCFYHYTILVGCTKNVYIK